MKHELAINDWHPTPSALMNKLPWYHQSKIKAFDDRALLSALDKANITKADGPRIVDIDFALARSQRTVEVADMVQPLLKCLARLKLICDTTHGLCHVGKVTHFRAGERNTYLIFTDLASNDTHNRDTIMASDATEQDPWPLG